MKIWKFFCKVENENNKSDSWMSMEMNEEVDEKLNWVGIMTS